MSYHRNRAGHQREVSLDADQIAPRLFQGSYPDPPHSAFHDFDVVVFCAEELQPKMQAPAGKLAVYVPMRDDPYRPVDLDSARKINDIARNLAGHVRSGASVLVTCAAGMNRSGLVSALTLMHLHGLSGEQAVRRVKARRKDDRGDSALFNPMFVSFLASLKGVR